MSRTYSVNIFSQRSIKNLIKDLEDYRSEIYKKCEQFVTEMAELGVSVGEQNVGHFGKYIVFQKEVEPTTHGCKAIIIARQTGTITSQWKTKGGIKSAEVSPLLMAEYGSGLKAQNPMQVEGVGQGTFPNQSHAFDEQGWYWVGLDNKLYHSYGIEPTQPVYKAYTALNLLADEKIKEIFGK